MLLLWALFGLVGGALAYRLADRLLEEGSGTTGWAPRCPRCGRIESPLRRIAVLALALRLRCPGCHLPPSRAQAIVELGTAGLVSALPLRVASAPQAAVYALATVVLVALTLTDLRERLIPNALSYPATGIALLLSLLPGVVGPYASLTGALIAGGAALAIYGLGRLLYRRGDVFGLGDVKLAVFVGAVTGAARALMALALGVLAGGIIGALVLILGRSRRATMPYGPALAIGAYLTWLLGV